MIRVSIPIAEHVDDYNSDLQRALMGSSTPPVRRWR